MEALRVGAAGALHFERHPYLTAGVRVHILHGPLAGMTGILVRRKNSCRVILSVDLIARSVALELDAADIERIA
jgi:transcription antitermination factor NusG